ncbi:MalY/PatB family protein [Clostridium sp. YIM B02551]|uniref:MalY/PatB family protein n=1 Tax=Clostridium sp. YIM B02551 TaxID=2910679 RepID=UPI001EEC374A|nr:PatB family C-S lyase [Clostridium sp. YIM B02551]
MRINFNEDIKRFNTSCYKWDQYGEDYIPLWVADMDFKSPEPIIKALKNRIEHGIFGYTKPDKELVETIVEYFKKEYNTEIKESWIVWLPSIVPTINVVCQMIDGSVMINTPVYPNIRKAPVNVNREVIEVPLKREQGKYTFDFEAMEKSIREDTKLFILCNPHNPVGRVFSKEELGDLAEFCERHGLILCSDEIHCQLIFEGKHIPLVSLGDKVSQGITLMSPGKTYNLPGIPIAFGVIPNTELRNKFLRASEGLLPHPGVLNYVVCKEAYKNGESWRKELLEYLKGNLEFLEREFKSRLPELKLTPVEGTYLLWIDFRETGIKDPYKFLYKKAKVILSDGKDFGEEGFLRLNFGCTRDTLVRAMDRIEKALKENKKTD